MFFLLLLPSLSFGMPVPSQTECEFYPKLEESIKCKSESPYLLGYGFPYCNRFQRKLRIWKGKLKAWIPDTTICLQQELIRDPSLLKPCKLMEDTAFGSHPTCYLKSGFCGFTYEERQKVMDVVAIADITGALYQSVAQMFRVKATCEIGMSSGMLHFLDFIFGFSRGMAALERLKAAELFSSIPKQNPDEYMKAVTYYLSTGELIESKESSDIYSQVSQTSHYESFDQIQQSCVKEKEKSFCKKINFNLGTQIQQMMTKTDRINNLHEFIKDRKLLKPVKF